MAPKCPTCGADSIRPVTVGGAPAEDEGTFFGRCDACGRLVELDRVDFVTLRQRTPCAAGRTISDHAEASELEDLPWWPMVARLVLIGSAGVICLFDRKAGIVAMFAAFSICLVWKGFSSLVSGRFVVKKGVFVVIQRGAAARFAGGFVLCVGLLFAYATIASMLEKR